MTATFHSKNPALQDSILVFNQDCELVSQLPIYYVLTVFQERYYQKAFFLSPRYWAASIYYNDIFCIAILAVGSFLTALIFMCAIERRLRYA